MSADPVPFLNWAMDNRAALTTVVGGVPAAAYGAHKLAQRRRARYARRVDLVFGTEDRRRRKVGITWEDARKHIRIRGLTGMGKSVLLEHLVMQCVEAGYGAVVIDPVGGELVDALADLLPEGTPMAVIDPADPYYATGFNPWQSLREEAAGLDMNDRLSRVHVGQEAEKRTVQWVALMKALYASDWGGKLEGTLTVACLTLIATPDATPTDIPLLLGRTSQRYRDDALTHYAGMYPPHITHMLDEFWDRFDVLIDGEHDADYRALVEPLTHKFTRLLQTYLVSLLGQSHPKGDPFELVDQSGVLMVKGRQGQIGPGPSRVLCSLVAYECWQRFMARPEGQRPPTLFVFDEAGQYVKGPLAKLIADGLTLGRKLGAVCTFAYQGEFQLDADTTNAIDNARTEILLTSGKKDGASDHSKDLPAHFAIVNRFARGGHIPPVTVRLTPPAKRLGTYKTNMKTARERYAERLDRVWEGIEGRRSRFAGTGEGRKEGFSGMGEKPADPVLARYEAPEKDS